MQVRIRNVAVAGVLAVSALVTSTMAHAQDVAEPVGSSPVETTEQQDETEARSLFAAGQAAFHDGRFEVALERWTSAYELSPRPAFLYNIGTALDRLGRLEDAIDEYEEYLRTVPDADNRNYVVRRVEVLREQAARGGAPPGETPSDESDADPVPLQPVSPTDTPPSRVGPIVLFGVAGAALVAGTITGLLANDKYGTLEDACPGGTCPADYEDEHDSLGTLTLTTDILLGAAVLSAASGAIWWLLDSPSEDLEEDLANDAVEDTVEATIHCGPTGCSGIVTSRF